MKSELAKRAMDIQDRLVSIRRILHMCPEIAQNEKETADNIKIFLDELGISYEDNVGGGYGIVATIEGKSPGRTLGLRADMDALAQEELVESDFKSKNPGYMHACGHDAHMTMLLGAASLLNDMKDEFTGTVKLIFQPAEEFSPTGGAPQIIESGLVDDVEAFFALHVWPELPLGQVGIRDGAMMANSDRIGVTFTGKASHAARPHEGVDAIIMASQFVNAIQPVISRETSAMDSAVLTISSLHAGSQYNSVASQAVLDGTCRTFNPKDRDRIESKFKTLAETIAQAYGGTADITYKRGYPAVINSPDHAELARGAMASLFGDDALARVDEPAMTGEDFSFYLQDKPGAFIWLGIGDENDPSEPLHSQNFVLNEDVLWIGAALSAKIGLDFLASDIL